MIYGWRRIAGDAIFFIDIVDSRFDTVFKERLQTRKFSFEGFNRLLYRFLYSLSSSVSVRPSVFSSSTFLMRFSSIVIFSSTDSFMINMYCCRDGNRQ